MSDSIEETIVKSFNPVIKASFLAHCLSQAILDDYCITISTLTGKSEDEVRTRINEKVQYHLSEFKKDMEID